MIRKQKIAIAVTAVLLIVGALVGSGITTGSLSSDALGDKRGGGRGFVCSEQAIAPDSRETREYTSNIQQRDHLTRRQSQLLSDPNVANNTCKTLNKKDRKTCEHKVKELRNIRKDLLKVSQNIAAYEECKRTNENNVALLQGSYNHIAAANYLAEKGIIVDNSANPAGYRLGDQIIRQETIGVVLKSLGLLPDNTEYTCRNKFSDITENWVCRIAEIAADNGITNAQNTTFRGTANMTIYEAVLFSMRSQCLAFGDTSPDGVKSSITTFGIKNAQAVNFNRAVTKGEFYVATATFADYAKANPGLVDKFSPGCNKGGDDILCVFDPSFCDDVIIPPVKIQKYTNSTASCYDGTPYADNSCTTPEASRASAEAFCQNRCSQKSKKCGVNSWRLGQACEDVVAGTLKAEAIDEYNYQKNVLAGTISNIIAGYKFTSNGEPVELKEINMDFGDRDSILEVIILGPDKTTEIARQYMGRNGVLFQGLNYVVEDTANIYIKVVTPKIGLEEVGKQINLNGFDFYVGRAQGVRSKKEILPKDSTFHRGVFDIVPVRISNVALVNSASGTSLASRLSNGTNNVAIVAVTTDSSNNTNTITGASLKTVLNFIHLSIEKNSSTTIGSFTLEKIGGSIPAFGINHINGTPTTIGSKGEIGFSSDTVDFQINNGSTVYYLVKALNVNKTTNDDFDDFIHVSLKDVNYSSDQLPLQFIYLKIPNLTQISGTRISE